MHKYHFHMLNIHPPFSMLATSLKGMLFTLSISKDMYIFHFNTAWHNIWDSYVYTEKPVLYKHTHIINTQTICQVLCVSVLQPSTSYTNRVVNQLSLNSRNCIFALIANLKLKQPLLRLLLLLLDDDDDEL